MKNKSIQQEFKQLLALHSFATHRYLLAISGGIDSMILLDLFRQTSANFQVAHCNFQLRGEESNGDEMFVREYCGKYNIPFHSVRFDVAVYQRTGNYSVEMACRNLRYDWFEEIQQQNQLDVLVTAHHLDDNIETFLINLSRGTGLKGLIGMQIDNGKIFRPLLNFTKNDLLAYAQSNEINWREDATNATDDYTRNKIRHHITPVLKQLHPQFDENFLTSLNHIHGNYQIIQQQIEEIRTNLFSGDNPIQIEISQLKKLQPLETYLHYLFEKYGFYSSKEILKFLDAETGSEIKSATYRLIKNRENLLLQTREEENEEEITIFNDLIEINSLNLKFVKSINPHENATEIVDFTSILFPLKLRKVKEGDYFFPIGMKGQKKLMSKFMKDLKLSKLEKEKVWLLCDQKDQIIWVVNYRLDERFKTTKTSKNFLNITVC
ncbi:tRNA lysidine(34) synthetase TilS [Empedobacter brevis]|uniref:tRNA lysidine(34) synthetase TilS n=1 Tax=Empedobacter brevis TaxID=247 RepID=UPI0033405A07